MNPTRPEFALSIEGMHCNGCVQRVRKALEALDGVELREVSVGSARGTYDPDELAQSALPEAIRAIGFAATLSP